VRVPGLGRGLSIDTSGRYADTMVSPPVTEAARPITTPCTKAGGVWSHHSAVRVSKG
jgi:hypothetical protein